MRTYTFEYEYIPDDNGRPWFLAFYKGGWWCGAPTLTLLKTKASALADDRRSHWEACRIRWRRRANTPIPPPE